MIKSHNTVYLTEQATKPDFACFAMTDSEVAAILRGWKVPRVLGEEVVRSSGVNPFTGKEVEIAGRRRLGLAQAADVDAIVDPSIWQVPWIKMGGDYSEHFDRLAMILCGWTRDYAIGEVSLSFFEGPPDSNDWFLRFPKRVTAAIEGIAEHEIRQTATKWCDASDDLDLDLDLDLGEAEGILRRLVPFVRDANGMRRWTLYWGNR